MKFLITGGAGFIGSHLCQKLEEALIVDNFNRYYNIKLKKYNKKLAEINNNKFLNLDISDLNSDHLNVEHIIHLAAQPGVRYSVENPIEVLYINLVKTVKLLEKIRKYKIDLKSFIFVSSSSIFGKIEKLPIDENHKKEPISPYGVSKLAAENYVKNYYLHYKIPTIIIRPFTVVGARQRPDMGLHKFIEAIEKKNPVTIFGNGNQTRDWTHVENIVQGIILCTKNKKSIGEDFNLGNGSRISVNVVIEKISSKLNHDIKINNKKRHLADPKDTQADISKAKKLLKYNPKKTLDDAIREQINFFLNHKDLY
jgi:UDP-glucose 4-epimerase